MMKVVFWSNVPRNGVTLNTAALASLGVQEYPLRITVTDNCPAYEGLASVMLGRRQELRLYEHAIAYPDYVGYALDNCLGLCPGPNVTPIISDKLSYLKRYRPMGPRLYDPKEEDLELESVWGRKGSLKDLCFLDTSSSAGGVRELEGADVAVVMLNRDERAVSSFFEEYKTLAGKAVFVLADYRRGSSVNRKFLNSRFHVPAERMAIIPHSENFALAAYDGDVPGFIERTFRERGGENYFFINETRHALHVLIKALLKCLPGRIGNLDEGRITVDEFKRGKIVPFDGEYRQ
ncbi:MAG: hypothetical protein ILP10_03875 [Lachnospiraceae bacterium]|nr:hypothetical protein [Lachnospiraceae bacterium]